MNSQKKQHLDFNLVRDIFVYRKDKIRDVFLEKINFLLWLLLFILPSGLIQAQNVSITCQTGCTNNVAAAIATINSNAGTINNLLINEAAGAITDLSGLSVLNTLTGNLTIRNLGDLGGTLSDLSGLSNLTSVAGNIQIGDNAASDGNVSLTNATLNVVGNVKLVNILSNTALVTVAMDGITGVTTGSLSVNKNSTALATVSFNNLTSVSVNVSVNNNNSSALTSVNFHNLTTVGNNLIIINNNTGSGATVDLTSLQSVGGNLTITKVVNGMLTLDNLTNVIGDIAISSNDKLTGLSIASLVSAGGDFGHSFNPLATSASFPNMSNVAGFFRMDGNPLMASVTGTSLSSVVTDFVFTNQDAVTDFDASFPALSTIGGDLDIKFNNALSACCVAACQVVVGGTKTVSFNTGNCVDLATAQAVCGPAAPQTTPYNDPHCYGEPSHVVRRVQVGKGSGPGPMPQPGDETVWRFLSFAPGPGSDLSAYSNGNLFTKNDDNNEFDFGNNGNSLRPKQFATGQNGNPIYGTYTFEVFIRNIANPGCVSSNYGPVTKTINFTQPPVPNPLHTDKAFCYGQTPTNNWPDVGVIVENTITADERVVWRLIGAPGNSDYIGGVGTMLFKGAACNQNSVNFGDELRVATDTRVIKARTNTPKNSANDPVYGTYTFMAFVENCVTGCVSSEVGPFSITIHQPPADPIPSTTMKMFCHGSVVPNLANTGVNVVNNISGSQRIVWELVSAPANSDLTPGLLNDDCNGPATNIVYDNELRIANNSTVIRVDNGSNSSAIVNNSNVPIIGTYIFNAYVLDCATGCISLAAGPFTITVKDPFPIITCPPAITVECGASLDPVDTGSPTTPTNNCCANPPTVTFNNVGAGGICPVKDVLTRTFTVVYADCGYTTTCDQIITIEDTTPPVVVTCPPDVTLEWPVGFNTQPVGPNTPQDPSISKSNYPNIVYTEVCGTVTVGFQDVLIGPNPGNCPNLWTVERTWIITDECGLTGTCVQTFTFTDTTPPTIACPADPAPIEWPAGFNTAAVGPDTPQDPSVAPAVYGMPTASDNCGNPAISYQDALFGPVPGDCPNLWTLQRTWTATDACGLTATCVQVFTFTDTTPPVITTCPPAVAIEGCGTGDIAGNGHPPYSIVLVGTEAEFTGSGGVASDNCAIVAWNYVDVASGTCPTTVTRTWTVTDACGLTATCTQVFTIDDTTPPTVGCTDIPSINLTANGDLTITPAQVHDPAGDSDNCGTVNLVSVSPNSFTCQDEGSNTVTLTAEDACGNQGTCTATVFIEDFITNLSATATAESCAGAADGTITASGTSGGGQLRYSLDGVNFQPSGLFANLSPGTYTVTFKVFGIPAVCVKTMTVTVAAGPPMETWYKDNDNDGWSDGISQVGCARPTGYKTAAELGGNTSGDCNDNDANAFPGQNWYKDGDNDSYTNGTTQTACLRPAGYKTAAELVNTTDIDCDDTNAAVNHGATEVCNGIDDDCDGMIDEGLGGLTYNGNVYFSTQAQVDAWSPCYSVINGSVTIVGVGINNLGPLSNIVDITGGLTIQGTGLTSMFGLDGLAHVGGTLTIYFNSSLTTLNGLEALNSVGGALYMYYNFNLSDCCAVYDLINGGVTGSTVIFFNKVGCNSVADINSNCAPPPPLIIGPSNEVASGQSIATKAVTVFPNPASTVLTVKIAANQLAGTIQLTDITGRIVATVKLTDGQSSYDLDVSPFSGGLYFVNVRLDGAERIVKRVVVK